MARCFSPRLHSRLSGGCREEAPAADSVWARRMCACVCVCVLVWACLDWEPSWCATWPLHCCSVIMLSNVFSNLAWRELQRAPCNNWPSSTVIEPTNVPAFQKCFWCIQGLFFFVQTLRITKTICLLVKATSVCVCVCEAEHGGGVESRIPLSLH